MLVNLNPGVVFFDNFSFFQVERIRKLQELAEICTETKGGKIMMYIMTSEHTKKPTEEFFEEHNFFGLDKNQVCWISFFLA